MNNALFGHSLVTWTLGAGEGAASAPPVAGRTDGAGDAAPATTAAPGQQGAPGGTPPNTPPSPFGGGFLYMIVAIFAVMIVMQIFGGRKEKKRRAEMLASIKRHDKVQTIGGVIGTVAEVRDDEIVLKVDESTNTKMRFSRAAVQQVLKSSTGEGQEATPEKVGA